MEKTIKEERHKAIAYFKKQIAKKVVVLATHNHIFEESKCCLSYVKIDEGLKTRCGKCGCLLTPYDIKSNAEYVAGKNEAIARVLEILV